MTTQTPPKVDTDNVTELDFQPVCEVTEAALMFGQVVAKSECGQPATYVGTHPCCDYRALVCDKHVGSGSDWYCGDCDERIPDYAMIWTRL